MGLCVYKRIRPEPIRLTLNGKSVVVKGGQMIVADNRQMMGVSGFAFIKLYDQRDSMKAANTNVSVSRPKPLIESFTDPSMEPMTIEVHEIPNQRNRPIEHKPLEKPHVFVETVEEIKPREPIGFNKESIEKLKSFDSKQWFALKKEDIIKFLEDANIDYKHVSSDKWELLKFLKKIIKEL